MSLLYSVLLAIFLSHVSLVAVAAEVTKCVTASSDGQPIALDDSMINDGYCDCIDTGADEPQTSACSGMEEWPSVLLNQEASDPPVFQCPEQPDLQLPPSRVNDDICDCCDGADEESTGLDCDDTCADIRKRQAEETQALQTAYTAGSVVRTNGVAAFVQLQASTAAELETLETVTLRELRDVKQVEAEKVLGDEKKVYAEYRIQRLGQSASIHEDLWGGITTAEEWIDFITVACQLAGELSDDQSAITCLPLRWAGLDSGLAWDASGRVIDNATSKDVDELIYYNSVATEKVYKVSDMENDRNKRTKGKRRLLHVAADDYYHEDEEEYYNDDDGYHGHEEDDKDSSDDSKDEEGNSKRDELLKDIRATKFSSSRANLLDNAETVLGKIKTLMEKDNEETKETETKESEGEPQNEAESENEGDADEAFDPAVLNSVRRELEDRKKVVERGFNYAVSAKVLLESVTDVSVLRSLATGIVFYGPLSSFHVYQVIVSAVKGLSMPSMETCSPSQSALWCPPEFVTNNGKKVPPSAVQEFMGTFCNKGEETSPVDPSTCLASEDDASSPSIPESVSNGYNGYYKPEPRETSDPLHSLLEAFYEPDEKETSMKNKATRADEGLQSILDEIDATEKKMKGLKDEIGGDDGPEKFGTDGELFSVKDECFSVEAGKYIYEICMFGKAAQKDIDKPKATGTSLGQWTGATTNIVVDRQGKEHSERVWKWERGAKCWNGPQRSATAYVTCGAATVVLSADEPDTCRYVLRVSSPIACDEEHRQRHNLD